MALVRERDVWSNYHITINLNAPASARSEGARLLRNAVEVVLRDYNNLWRWLKYCEQNAHGAMRNFAADERYLVPRIRARGALEASGRRNLSVHAHILLEVTHRTRIRIDEPTLKRLLRANLGRYGPGCNIDIAFKRGDPHTEDRLYTLHYLLKDGMPEQPAHHPDNAALQRTDGGHVGALDV